MIYKDFIQAEVTLEEIEVIEKYLLMDGCEFAEHNNHAAIIKTDKLDHNGNFNSRDIICTGLGNIVNYLEGFIGSIICLCQIADSKRDMEILTNLKAKAINLKLIA